jgi:hypothetical protein
VAHQLAAGAQYWADEMMQARLSLLAPDASAAAQARQQMLKVRRAAAGAASAAAEHETSRKGSHVAAAAAAAAQPDDKEEEEEEEQDEVAAVLELQAADVLDVSEELVQQLYNEENPPALSAQPQQQPQKPVTEAAGRDQLSSNDGNQHQVAAAAAAAAEASTAHTSANVADNHPLLVTAEAGTAQNAPEVAFVRPRSEQEVLAERQFFAGIREQLSPQQKWEIWKQWQRTKAARSETVDGVKGQQQEQLLDDGLPEQMPAADLHMAGAQAPPALVEVGEAEAVEDELPALTTWLQTQSAIAVVDDELLLQQQEQQHEEEQQQVLGPGEPSSPAPKVLPAGAESRPASSKANGTLQQRMAAVAQAKASSMNKSSRGKTKASPGRATASNNIGKQWQQQQQQQQQQQLQGQQQSQRDQAMK